MPWVVFLPSCQSPRWPYSCHFFPGSLTLRHSNSFLWKLLLKVSACKYAMSSTPLKSFRWAWKTICDRRLIYFMWCHGHHDHLALAVTEYGVTQVPVNNAFWRCVNALPNVTADKASMTGRVTCGALHEPDPHAQLEKVEIHYFEK